METSHVMFVIFLATVYTATEVNGKECTAGQERGSDGQLHWVVNEDPDGCTDLRLAGGLNMQRRVNSYVEKSIPGVTTQTQREPNYECSYTTAASQLPTFRYIMGPLSMPFKLDFKVKSHTGVMIALAEKNATDSIFAEISIVKMTRSKAVIRACHSDICTDLFGENEEYDGFINGNEYRPFWIGYIEGVVTVGKGGQQEAFSQWDAGAYHGRVTSEVYVGISGGGYVPGLWLFNTAYVCE